MNLLIYILAAIAALQIAGFVTLFCLWAFCKMIAKAQINRLTRHQPTEG